MIADGYTRLSEESDTSIPRQKRHIRAYCDEHGLELRQIYDDGQRSSGWDDERTEYGKLRESIGAEDGPDAIVLNDKRRLVRDIDEVLRLVADLRTHDVELHTCLAEGPLDLSDPIKMAIEIVEAASAHKEKRAEIQKARTAVDERLEAGYDHGRPPFGLQYDDDKQYWVPDANFETVLDVIALHRAGMSQHEIAKTDGVPVSQSTVSRIVQREEEYLQRAPTPDGVDSLGDLLQLVETKREPIHEWDDAQKPPNAT